MTNKKPFVSWVLHSIEIPIHQNLIHWLSPTAALEQFLRAIWVATSLTAVLILPQIKLNSQLSSCTSFFIRHNYEGDARTGLPGKSMKLTEITGLTEHQGKELADCLGGLQRNLKMEETLNWSPAQWRDEGQQKASKGALPMLRTLTLF